MDAATNSLKSEAIGTLMEVEPIHTQGLRVESCGRTKAWDALSASCTPSTESMAKLPHVHSRGEVLLKPGLVGILRALLLKD